jgi:nitroreductase
LLIYLNTQEAKMIKELIAKNRSTRRFKQASAIERETLVDLVDLARLSPSAANTQPLKYILSSEAETNAKIFPRLAWAGYLTDWSGPGEGEKPAGYIIVLGDKGLSESFGCDQGIAAQSILLGAVEKGLAGCIIGMVERQRLRKDLNIGEEFEILLVIALGEAAEKIVIDTVDSTGDIKYWRDDHDTHHVPKRALDEIIIQ